MSKICKVCLFIMPLQNGIIINCNYYKKLYIEEILNTSSKIHCGTCSVVGQIKYNLSDKEYYLHRFEFLKWKIPVPLKETNILIYQIYTDQAICGVQLPINENVRVYGEILLKPKWANKSVILRSGQDLTEFDELKNYQIVISLHRFNRIYDPESLFISELVVRKCMKNVDKHHKPKIKE